MIVQALRQLLIADVCLFQFGLDESARFEAPFPLAFGQSHCCAQRSIYAEYERFLLTMQVTISVVCDRDLTQAADVAAFPPFPPGQEPQNGRKRRDVTLSPAEPVIARRSPCSPLTGKRQRREWTDNCVAARLGRCRETLPTEMRASPGLEPGFDP